jgi:hypothetical protein
MGTVEVASGVNAAMTSSSGVRYMLKIAQKGDTKI